MSRVAWLTDLHLNFLSDKQAEAIYFGEQCHGRRQMVFLKIGIDSQTHTTA